MGRRDPTRGSRVGDESEGGSRRSNKRRRLKAVGEGVHGGKRREVRGSGKRRVQVADTSGKGRRIIYIQKINHDFPDDLGGGEERQGVARWRQQETL